MMHGGWKIADMEPCRLPQKVADLQKLLMG